MFDTLGRIKELREIRNMSVYKLAQLSGIPQSTIATWYQKDLCPPIDKLETICGVFGIALSDFFQSNNVRDLTPEQESLLDQWTLLDSRQKKAVFGIIDAFIYSKNINS